MGARAGLALFLTSTNLLTRNRDRTIKFVLCIYAINPHIKSSGLVKFICKNL